MTELFQQFFFFFCAFLIVVAALNLVFNSNPVYGSLGMVGGFFMLSMVYILLNQGFYASVQLLVYAGAIMVLFIFIIMLLNLKKDTNPTVIGKYQVFAFLIVGGLFVKLIVIILPILPKHDLLENQLVKEMNDQGSLSYIGSLLFDKYLLPFELISLLLLIAVVGTVLITKKHYPPQDN